MKSVFSESVFSESVFSESVFSESIFSESVFSESVFPKVSLSKVNFCKMYSTFVSSKLCKFIYTETYHLKVISSLYLVRLASSLNSAVSLSLNFQLVQTDLNFLKLSHTPRI